IEVTARRFRHHGVEDIGGCVVVKAIKCVSAWRSLCASQHLRPRNLPSLNRRRHGHRGHHRRHQGYDLAQKTNSATITSMATDRSAMSCCRKVPMANHPTKIKTKQIEANNLRGIYEDGETSQGRQYHAGAQGRAGGQDAADYSEVVSTLGFRAKHNAKSKHRNSQWQQHAPVSAPRWRSCLRRL